MHLLEGARVMLIKNVRTDAGLVNGSVGRYVGVVMKTPEERLRARHAMARRGSGGGRVVAETARAVLASDVKYAVVDFPGYKGPCLYAGHPTWVPSWSGWAIVMPTCARRL